MPVEKMLGLERNSIELVGRTGPCALSSMPVEERGVLAPNHLERRRMERLREGAMATTSTRRKLPQQGLACMMSIALVERAHAHAVPRTTCTLMIVL